VAIAEGLTHFVTEFSPEHPEYSIDTGPCTVCVLVWARFTPRTDSQTLKQLLDINLDCLTRWKARRTQREIIPEAYALAKADETRASSSVINDSSCQIPLELVARDSRYVSIAEVASIAEMRNSDGPVHAASFQSTESLKNNAYIGPLLFRNILTLRPETILPGGIPASKLLMGDKIILLFGAGPDEPDVIPLEDACSFIPYSPESMAAVQRGVALDAIPEGY
jgi:hypothetical protein